MAYKLKEGRIQHNKEPQVGDVVLVKDDLPRGSWKIGRICELRTSQDGQIRSGRVLLPNKKTLNRPLNLLYPIECSKEAETKDRENASENQSTGSPQETSSGNESITIPKVKPVAREPPNTRPKRQAAQRADEKIKDWLSL